MNHIPFQTYLNWIGWQSLREAYRGEYIGMWWQQHIQPLLAAGHTPPKRFWLHLFHRYHDLYLRMAHDYPNALDAMFASLDAKARHNYMKSIANRAKKKDTP